jgi:autotransporter-associated beta strand protein
MAWGLVLVLSGREAAAINITGYLAEVNSRFYVSGTTSGFPTAPTPNGDPGFIGAAYDWSAVGWDTKTTDGFYKNYGMLSPVHFLAAWHYEQGAKLTQGVRIYGRDDVVTSATNPSPVVNLGWGVKTGTTAATTYDLSIGRLAAPPTAPANMARMAVLDRYATSASTDYAVYQGLTVLAYGRGSSQNASPRIGAAVVDLGTIINSDPNQAALLTLRSGTPSVQLQGGDSGSPLLVGWTNADGGQELTVLGLNTGTNATYNFMSLLAAPGPMAAANAVMTPAGYALRVAGDVSSAWQGGSGANATERSQLSRAGNWTSGSIPSDQYVRFAGDETTFRTITVNAATDLRGLYFNSTGSGTLGFGFGGASTLTIGRGGVTNYDTSRQEFTAPVSLGDHQYWDVGAGGVTAGGITTNGRLLEIAGSGTARITGSVTGTGGLALSGHRLELTGSNSYSGGTWVHAGTLVVNGGIGASSGVSVAAAAALAGSGTVAAISGAGSVGPGNSPGILTAPSVDPSAGLDFDFEFTQAGSPTWSSGTASGNDVLRLTSGTSPFGGQSLTAANGVNVYLNSGPLTVGGTFRGGFFTDRDVDFLASIEGATFAYYLATLSGTKQYGGMSYAAYGGPYTFTLSTVAETATFAGGSESGFVMQFVVVPEPAGWMLLAGAAVAAGAAARRRRRCRAGISPSETAALADDRGDP